MSILSLYNCIYFIEISCAFNRYDPPRDNVMFVKRFWSFIPRSFRVSILSLYNCIYFIEISCAFNRYDPLRDNVIAGDWHPAKT